MSRPVIYFSPLPPSDRWFTGDHVWRAWIRSVIRGAAPIGGIGTVYVNLIRGLDELGADYVTNIPFCEVKDDDRVGVIGVGVQSLSGYNRPNQILAGVAVVEHPMQCPTLFEEYPISRYVVHSEWVAKMYEKHYGQKIVKWAVGIDTHKWSLAPDSKREIDFLVYDKIMWDRDRVHEAMVGPILSSLKSRGLTYELIRYGSYRADDLKCQLDRSRSMLFLCEHETQGLAYQQAMSCGVPILAWDPGQWLDPWRFRYGETFVPSTSVPFFDERCGLTFSSLCDFDHKLDEFLKIHSNLSPRSFVMDNLTLAGCAANYLDILNDNYN